MDVLATSTSNYETALVLNTVVLLQDGKPGYTFLIKPENIKSKGGHVSRRISYLIGKPMVSSKKKRGRKKK